MATELTAKPLKYKSLPGLTEKQLTEHHDVLYAGYIKKYNEIMDKLGSIDISTANATYSDLRELQIEKGFALNAIKLHEAYFDNMTETPKPADGKVRTMIEAQWGTYEKWAEEFAALGLAARGWVILAYDYSLGRLDNYALDAHNQGGIVDTELVLVLDVYEHAYFLDYGTARKDYIAKFVSNVDWDVVNARIAHHNQ